MDHTFMVGGKSGISGRCGSSTRPHGVICYSVAGVLPTSGRTWPELGTTASLWPLAGGSRVGCRTSRREEPAPSGGGSLPSRLSRTPACSSTICSLSLVISSSWP